MFYTLNFELTAAMTTLTFSTPDAAEAAFYRAFESTDLSAMMAVWHNGDYVECIHPMGGRLKGLSAIQKSWEQIFKNAPKLKFNVSAQQRIYHPDIAVHIVNENIYSARGAEQHSVMIATNIYEHIQRGWRMILHHASPAPRNTVPSVPPPATAMH